MRRQTGEQSRFNGLRPLAGLRAAWADAIAVLALHAPMPLIQLVPRLAIGLGVALYLYVPVHELLHALGCAAVSGRVTRIEIAPWLGGTLLARLSPVISAETEYAGRLAGFDLGGSTLKLLATDFAPYLLTVFVGVPLLRRLRARPCAWLLPAGVLVGLAPWMSVPGDYYEMGSAIVTAALEPLGADWSALRSDDLVKLLGALWTAPESLGVAGPLQTLAALGTIAVSVVLAVLMASATYALGALVSSALRFDVVTRTG